MGVDGSPEPCRPDRRRQCQTGIHLCRDRQPGICSMHYMTHNNRHHITPDSPVLCNFPQDPSQTSRSVTPLVQCQPACTYGVLFMDHDDQGQTWDHWSELGEGLHIECSGYTGGGVPYLRYCPTHLGPGTWVEELPLTAAPRHCTAA